MQLAVGNVISGSLFFVLCFGFRGYEFRVPCFGNNCMTVWLHDCMSASFIVYPVKLRSKTLPG